MSLNKDRGGYIKQECKSMWSVQQITDPYINSSKTSISKGIKLFI